MFVTLVIAVGVVAGLLGDATMLLLTTVEHLAFGYHSGSLLGGWARLPAQRVRHGLGTLTRDDLVGVSRPYPGQRPPW